MSKPIDYHQIPFSAPCRLVTMTIKELGIEDKINTKLVDLLQGEHLKPEFTSINPQHVVPTIVDNENGLKLWESRAIAAYLVNKFKPGSLIPTDMKDKATVERHLYFDAATLYAIAGSIYIPVFRSGSKPDESRQSMLKDKLKLLDAEVDGKKYVVGDTLTLADLSYLTTISFIFSISHVTGVTGEDVPNVAKYVDGLKQRVTSFSEVCEEPMKKFKEFLDSKIPKE